ncbi:PKD domain-containing protein [Pontibacter vulgaris]|uniref:Ig-like domain-containing protein n=1 Tax=Pontibacter vulgaris TaxID=2905679 RepID=UPI001FA70921|nr:T9SS type A sorting domain-containing protein [Pontibacter vulgaris]
MQKNFTKLILRAGSMRQYAIVVASLLLVLAAAAYLRAAVGITVTGGTPITISADLAANATLSTPTYTVLGPINFRESSTKDEFGAGSKTIEINAPTGWSFYSTAPHGITVTPNQIDNGARSINATITSVTASKITITYTGAVTNKQEEITISGIKIIASLGSSAPETVKVTAGGTLFTTSVDILQINHVNGTARTIEFSTQPGGALIDASLNPQPSITLKDQFGKITTTGASATNSVTIALGTNPSGGVLNGTKTVVALSGVAAFSGLNIDKAGVDYTLVANVGSLTATSNPFTVNNKQPIIASINKEDNSALCLSAGDAGLTIRINGTNFMSGSTVLVNGVSRAATFISASILTTTITTGELATAGSLSIVVKNPTPAQNNGASDAATLTINPLLTAGSITGAGDVCVGTQGKTYSIAAVTGAKSYAWAVTGDATIVSGQNTRTVTLDFGSTAGDVELSVRVLNQCDKPGAPETLTIKVGSLAKPEITAESSTEFCTGGSVTLNAPVQEGYTYQWKRNGDDIGNGEASIEVSTSGSYSVVITSGACTSTSDAVAVTVNTPPTATISGNSSFCAGSSITLTANTDKGTVFQWYKDGVLIPDADDATLTVDAALQTVDEASYTVAITDAKGCATTSNAKLVTKTPLPVATIAPAGSVAICAGSKVTLTASEGDSYEWSNGATTRSIEVSAADSYTVEVTTNGCSATSEAVEVTVNPLPTALAGADQNVCDNAIVTLGGAANSNYTYSWEPTAGLSDPASANPTITVDNSTNNTKTYTFTLTVTDNETGCTDTDVVNINVYKPVIATANVQEPVCTGGTIQLSAAGGTSYEWSGPNGYTSTQQNPAIANAAATMAGTYTVTARNAGGCESIATVNVVVNELPTATISADGPLTFCAGGSVELTASSGESYLWSNGATTPSITVSTTGNYTVRVTNAAGCSATSAVTSVTVNPVPVAEIVPSGSTTFCAGGSVTLSSKNTAAGYTYAWYKDGGTTAVGTSSTLAVSDAGSYTLEITSSAGCSDMSVATVVTETPLPVANAGTDKTICSGGNAQLGNAAVAGYTYSWSPATGLSSTSAVQPTVTLTNTGTAPVTRTYTLTVTANGCTSIADEVTVTVNPLPVVTLGSFNDICVSAGTITLSGGLPAGGSYSGPGVSNGQFDPAVAGVGTKTITYTFQDAQGCSNSATSTITVTAEPTVTLAAFSPVCVDAPAFALSGGSPAGGSYTVNGTAATQFNPATAGVGTHTIVYSYSLNGCTKTATRSIVVNPLPTANAGEAQAKCLATDGKAIFNLSGSVTNATPAWTVFSTSGGATATVTNANTLTPTVTVSGGTTVGAVTMRLTASSSCGSVTSDVVLTVNPRPIANAGTDQTKCTSGASVLFTLAGVATNGTGQWSFQSATQSASATIADPDKLNSDVTFSGIGSVTLRLTTTGPCGTTTDDVVLTVNPTPVVTVNSPTVCSGSQATVTASVTGGTPPYRYEWTVPAGAIKPANTVGTFQTSVAGTYSVIVTDKTGAGCASASASGVVTLTPAPTANAGAAQTKCVAGATTSFTLAGSGSNGTFMWSVVSTTGGATASITNPTQLNSGVVVTGTGSATLQLTTTGNAPCGSATSTVTLTVNPNPVATFTGVTNGQVLYSGGSNVTLTPTVAGGTFSIVGGGAGITGNTFSPCTALGTSTEKQVTIRYTITSGTSPNQCTSTEEKTVTVKKSTYTIVVKATPMPFCRGDNVNYETFVYRDVAKVTYPYLVDSQGRPVYANGTLVPAGRANLPVANDKPVAEGGYPFPAGTPDIIKKYGFRFFEPIVEKGNGEQMDPALFTYQWTKNEGNERKNDLYKTSDAGLSSMDYYGVYVTSKNSSTCLPTLSGQISDRKYSAEIEEYTIALTANPVCQPGTINFTATLNSAFPYWSTANLQVELVRTRGNLVLATATYNGTNTFNFSFNTATTDLVNGDEVYVRFNSIIDQYRVNTKCTGSSKSNTVTIQIDQPAAITTDISATPQNKCEGETATYTVSATGTGIQFVWYKTGSTDPLAIGGNISVQNTTTSTTSTSTLTIANVAEANEGQYYVKVSNAATTACTTTVQSGNATLVVNQLPLARTVSGSTFCPLTSPVGGNIELQGSESGVVYTLKKGTATVETKTGNGSNLVFGPHAEGTYIIEAATASNCTNSNVGQATITKTEPPFVTGEMQIFWRNNTTTWEVHAISDHEEKGVDMTGFTYEWYTGTTEENAMLLTTTTYPADSIMISNPTTSSYVKCVIKGPDGMCIESLMLDNREVVPLPVEIMYLKAVKRGNDVVLRWATAMERDNTGFEVQMSENGYTYKTLSFVPTRNGNAATKQEYEYIDSENGKYGTRYYRLKQIDEDGSFKYFGPQAITMGELVEQVKAYPNPFRSEINLEMNVETEGDMLITVTNSIGKVLLERTVQVQKGMNTERLVLDAALPRGIYFITTRMGDDTNHFKLLKQ